jgi:hypothetical protein
MRSAVRWGCDMVSVKTSGSQSATLATEHDLATITDAGIYEANVDSANLVDGETLTIRWYGKARSSDTERLIGCMSFSHGQTDNLKKSLPIVSPHHLRVTLQQDGGTGRAFSWAVYQL